MAGVTDSVFRQLCKAEGADVLTTEFVSAEGILHRNERTREMVDFDPAIERPVGVQLFGAEPERLAEAARAVVEWVQPDFIDLNFGCPVNKVVSKNGGSSLLRDCPLLEAVARAVVRACAPLGVPVTAKIRIGWDEHSINAVRVGRLLEECGIVRLAVHGRTKAQGYTGEADWSVIGEVAEALRIPVIGNGDLSTVEEVAHRRRTTRVSGVMIGRGAMTAPWLFGDIRRHFATGEIPPPRPLPEVWAFILRHARLHLEARRGSARAKLAAKDPRSFEHSALASLRARLMAYSRGLPDGRHLRGRFSQVSSVAELEDLAGQHLAAQAEGRALEAEAVPLETGS
ncbi:MAG: tRNA-dihydrouridine synthase [Verrucomicrobia bacterium]|nr:tRNA-dihydrouridine synthase [Verrucomicrobiota bacterium]